MFLSFTPCPLPRSEYFSHSIAAKQWCSIAAKQWHSIAAKQWFVFGFPPLDPLLSPTLGTLQSLHSLRTLQSLHCCEAMALNCCEAMVFGVFLSFTPCPLLRSEYLSSSIAAKQWYSIAAKQWFFFPPVLHPLPSPTLRILYSIAAKQWYSLVLLT